MGDLALGEAFDSLQNGRNRWDQLSKHRKDKAITVNSFPIPFHLQDMKNLDISKLSGLVENYRQPLSKKEDKNKDLTKCY